MAELSPAEAFMFAQYYGDRDLVHNDSFWQQVLTLYRERVLSLPLVDDSASRRRLHDLLECPPHKCNDCCSYKTVPVSDIDIKRLEKVCHTVRDYLIEEDGQKKLSCEKGCPFLKDGACSVYFNRPDACMAFPIQNPVSGQMNSGQPFQQITYRIKCEAGIKVIRAIMEEACSKGMMLLPDLSLVANLEANNAINK